MKIPLELLNLLHNKPRTAAAVAGIAFPFVLIFLQLGLYGAVLKTATLIQEGLNADIFILPKTYVYIAKPGSFPSPRLHQAAQVDGVVETAPLHVGVRVWKDPQTRNRRHILVFGFNPDDRVFRLPEVIASAPLLKKPGTVLTDLRSRPFYGSMEKGLNTEISLRSASVVGRYALGTGFASAGSIIVSDLSFAGLFGRNMLDRVNVGLVKLRPDADAAQVAAGIRALLPSDVRVLTRSEMQTQEEQYWVRTTSIGSIFGIGVAVAFAVGLLLLFQVLASDIEKRLPEFATLKAIGYADRYLSALVMRQSLILAVVAYVPAFLVSLALYEVTREAARLPIGMDWGRAILVLLLALGMSSLSAYASLRRLRRADPADLF